MAHTRYRFWEHDAPYFLTCTVVAWLPVFAQPWAAQVVLDSWHFLQSRRGVQLHGYVILENHVHWIAAGDHLPEQVLRFKSYTARCILDELTKRGFETTLKELRFFKVRQRDDQAHQLWQEGSHPQQIQSDEMMIQKLEYIHANPVRRGYVDRPEHWRYSSARNYAGLEGLIEVQTNWA